MFSRNLKYAREIGLRPYVRDMDVL